MRFDKPTVVSLSNPTKGEGFTPKQMLKPEYVVGLADGEGSFTAYIKNPDQFTTRKRRVLVEPRFYIKLIEKDKDILYQLKEFFGCGSVYFQRDVRPNHQQCYRYEVFNWGDLENIIIPFFKKNKLKFKSKVNDFKIFCDLMKRFRRKEHYTLKGLRNLCKIKARMH